MFYEVSEKLEERLENDHTYHKPFGDQAQRYEDIRREAMEFCFYLAARAPESRELSIALGHVEEAVFYANAAIARNEVDTSETVSLTPAGAAVAAGLG